MWFIQFAFDAKVAMRFNSESFANFPMPYLYTYVRISGLTVAVLDYLWGSNAVIFFAYGDYRQGPNMGMWNLYACYLMFIWTFTKGLNAEDKAWRLLVHKTKEKFTINTRSLRQQSSSVVLSK